MSGKTNPKSLLVQKRGKPAVMKPQLTSLIDVMTILLVFLLKSFSVDGSLITISPGLELAESRSKMKPVVSFNIEVTPEILAVDEVSIATLAEIAESDAMMIDGLYHKLLEAAQSPLTAVNQGRIIIQCDKNIDFKILKKVMYTCGKAKFFNFSFLVLEKV